MKIVVHDYSGHPFQVQLSRSLARRGYDVVHLFSSSFQTPKGSLERKEDDPSGFEVQGIAHSSTLSKYSYLKRRQQELKYGETVASRIAELKPDVVISANTPLDAQRLIRAECNRIGAAFIFWVQDYYSIAIRQFVKIPIIGILASFYYGILEGSLLKSSDGIVVITDDFIDELNRWKVPKNVITTIPNWAPIQELPVRLKENQWASKRGLHQTTNIVYSGTLGLKHNPELLLQLAIHFRDNSGVRIIVISEGLGADFLQREKKERHLDNLLLFGFQPYDDLPDILGSADVLVSILDSEAGKFSVPSKVLTYLCSNRPLLLSVPHENLSSRIVETNEAGFVVSPDSQTEFINAADKLVKDLSLRQRLGDNARKYAERYFDIDRITDQFEEVVNNALK